MKLYFITVAIAAAAIAYLLRTEWLPLLQSPVERVVTVKGDSSSAPVPVSVDLHLHKNGSVSWKVRVPQNTVVGFNKIEKP